MIAYDTNILIYALEGIGPFAAAAQAAVRQGEQEGAVLSVLAWQELMTGAVLRGNNVDAKVARALRDLTATKFMPVSHAICERAVGITGQYGKQAYGYDAIHLATAIEHKAAVFITNDKSLLGLHIEGLEILSL